MTRSYIHHDKVRLSAKETTLAEKWVREKAKDINNPFRDFTLLRLQQLSKNKKVSSNGLNSALNCIALGGIHG